MAKRSQPGRSIKNFGLQHAKARSIAPTALACEVRDEKPLSVYLEPVVMAQLTELAERKHQSISLVAEAAIASVLAAEDRDLAARRNRFFWGGKREVALKLTAIGSICKLTGAGLANR